MSENTGFDAREQLLDAMRWRRACKRYDPTRHVSDEDFQAILEAARLTPSSFGLEPWKVLVVEGTELTEALEGVAWGMKKNADRNVVILARRKMNAFSLHVGHMMGEVQGLTDGEDRGKRRLMFGNFQLNDFHLDTPERVFAWSRMQCYLMLETMLMSAALLRVDSTPVEGFNIDKANDLLASRGLMDPEEFGVAVLCQFGYRDPSHLATAKTRQDFADVFEVVR